MQVVIAAGGLGTRVEPWAAVLPKEFQPIGNRPGIVALLEEITDAGARRAILVHHQYYGPLYGTWAARALTRGGRAGYRAAAGLPDGSAPVSERLDLRFVPQRGAYGDLTSLSTALPLLDRDRPVHVVFSDMMYPLNAMAAVCSGSADAQEAVVLARPFDLAEVHTRGVIICAPDSGGDLMTGLVEKPTPVHAAALFEEHGPERLRLLEGRFRLPPPMVESAIARPHTDEGEPRLSLALAAWSAKHLVRVVTIDMPMTDLGVVR